MTRSYIQPTVAVAGGGLAGLAAACALADSGFRVNLFERRPYLGGRASSYEHPGTGEVVDNCQHVLFRVCTNLIEFYERIGVADKIRWYDEMTFIEPGGRASVMHASPLPAPLHTAPSFLRFPFLDATDKLAIARAMIPLTLTTQPDTGDSFAQWLQRHGQTQHAIDRFWKPILISALSEELDLISVPYAAQVVRESMKTPAARHMGVPTIPLTELYNAAGDYIRARGGELQFRSAVTEFQPETSQVCVQLAQRQQAFDYLVLALPFDGLDSILPDVPESARLHEMLSHFECAPITGIHLWFDRQISDLDHALLLDRTIQWMFHKSRLLSCQGPGISNGQTGEQNGHAGDEALGDVGPAVGRRQPGGRDFAESSDSTTASAPKGRNGSYVELVVSSSKVLVEKSRAEIIELALAELHEFIPAARKANLLKSTVIKEVHATYSPCPGIDLNRPRPETIWPRMFLAGDWIATGWPATMEGAVRGGYMAAESVAHVAGLRDASFLVPDLPASGLMRLFV